MKTKTKTTHGPRQARSMTRRILTLFLVGAITTSTQLTLQAQSTQEATYTKPTWWFGAAAGANLNFYQGTTQRLNDDLMVPNAFRHGFGVGLYAAPLLQYHRPESRLGAMLQVGYDNRSGDFDQITTSCNCPADLEATLSYLTVEPSLRFAPFKSRLYFYAGPRFAFNLDKSFTYQLGLNPDVPGQAPTPAVNGDFSDVEPTLLSMQIGAGYDIPLSSRTSQTQFAFSPFVAFLPYFGADPRSIETWTLSTLRVGASLKFGRGERIREILTQAPAAVPFVVAPLVVLPDVAFTVHSPMNIPVDRRVRETFPIRNYVFFDLESTEIPERYVTLRKDEVKDFSEDRLEVFTPKTFSGKSDRQMVVYYNVLNILGMRLAKYPTSNITLSGSSEEGVDDGRAMATSIKRYLVEIFEIKESRITVVGRTKSSPSSEQPGATKELVVLRQEDRRVEIETQSPELLMEFQTGPNSPLRPVEIAAVQVAPLDSYVSFQAQGANEAYTSWRLEIKDKNGIIQQFGPFTQDVVTIPGKTILGTNADGDYNVTMVGTTRGGLTERQQTDVKMVLWKQPENEQGMRFSVIFEFNDSRSIDIYQDYLTDIVAPKIPRGATVIIHGYTDTIGNENNNMALSQARANTVLDILKRALDQTDRRNVTLRAYGFGEDNSLSPFDNDSPEGRFYNRTVTIDIIPVIVR